MLTPTVPLTSISRVTTLKILGVTFTNSLSVAEHVHAVITSSAQTLYALRVLRAHGMDDVSLQTIFHSVVIAKLTHATSAWWGFSGASDRGRQRLAAFIRRSDRIVVLYQQTFQRSQTSATTPMRKCLQPSPATAIGYYTSPPAATVHWFTKLQLAETYT